MRSGIPSVAGSRPGRTGPRLAAALLGGLCLLLAGGHSDPGPREEDALTTLRNALRDDLAAGQPFHARLSLTTAPPACADADREPGGSALTGLSPGRCRPLSPPRRSARTLHAARAVDGVSENPRADHLLGLLELVSSDGAGRGLEVAHQRLRRAADVDPASAETLNDLAVAQALDAERSADPRSLIRALVTSELALERSPGAAAPAYNQALFLERLGLEGSALQAWRRFLATASHDPFEAAARQALADLEERARNAPPDLAAATRLALTGDPEAAIDLATTDPQRARELALGPLLGAWGEAHLAADAMAAERHLGLARRLGAKLAASREVQRGECSVERAVERIDRAANDLAQRRRLATAHSAHARGDELFRQLRPTRAEAHFQRVRELVDDDHPLDAWARMGLGGGLFYRQRHERAAEEFQALLTDTGKGCQQAVAGRAAWGLGMSRLRQGRYTTALGHFRDARRRFLALRESENLGAVETLLGETLEWLGRDEEAWRSRSRALRALTPHRGSLRRHNLLWELARSAAPELGPRAALLMADECVLNAAPPADPGLLPECLLWRARFHAAGGRVDRALADLDLATSHNQARPDGPAPRQVAADLELARGVVLAGHEPATALAPLSAALDHYRRQGLVLPRPEALLTRGRALRALGQPRRALADLEAALDLYRDQRARIPDLHLRRSFTETVQAIFEEALELLAGQLGAAPEETLRLAEEARDLPFARRPGDVAASSPDLPLDELAERADGAAILVYTWTSSRLHVWRLRGGVVSAASRPVDRPRLRRRIAAFVTAVRRGAPLDELAPEATDLHRLLLPRPLADLPAGVPLFVVPDRQLSSLPFDLLRDPRTGRWLVEEHPLSLAPSLRSLAAGLDPSLRLPEAPRGATLVADPAWDRSRFTGLRRLPEARSEAERIAGHYPESVLLAGPEATVDALLAHLDGHPVLHFSGHAVFNARSPSLSYLPLAPGADGGHEAALYSHDLRTVRLRRLRLVVLSACTGLGPTDRRTLAISGLARPFLDAGANAVLGALWPVTDRDAARLLPDFHRRFLAGGDAVEALRQTKLAQLAHPDPELRRPEHWAGFQIVGQARIGTAGGGDLSK